MAKVSNLAVTARSSISQQSLSFWQDANDQHGDVATMFFRALKAVPRAARFLVEGGGRQKQIVAQLESIEELLCYSNFASYNSTEARERILSLARLLRPHVAVGHNKIRAGRKGDGGYVMIDDFKDIGGALSFGIASEMSWDLAIAALGIDVHQFDHSIEAPPATHSSITFHGTKIVGLPSSEGETLESVLVNTAVDSTRDWVLKVDIEGDEWAVFDAASDTALRRLRQIVCEFHGFGSIATEQQQYERCLSVLRKLEHLFGVVHVHANNTCGMILIGGVPFPDVIEVTFARRDHYELVTSDEIFPTPLDCANKANRPDYFLGHFVFN